MTACRPEKDHEKQLRSFAKFHENYPAKAKGVKLVLIGACRHEKDQQLMERLRELSAALGIKVPP